jgi:DNA primase
LVRYPPELLEEIRTRLPASTVVGRKVRLKKAGREWKGLSPFNAEKTPSFYVNDQKQFYHDFSSGKHGDIFTFLMETEGLSFPEAVERLAGEAGVALPKQSAESREVVERRKDLYEVLELACQFFERQLQSPAGQGARDYLARRDIAPATLTEFRLGYAPDERGALLAHLRAKGVEDGQILAAGLAVQPDDGRPLYDRFRGRAIIPIQDGKGRVVAFGGRALAAETQPKYLNSPETELFRKGEMVFNHHRAREAAFRTNAVVVVEGYLDAISVFQAGVKAVVATLGTAFTEDQIRALWRLAPEPVVCFDGDKAGRQAAFKAIDRILPALRTGHSFRFAFIPGGKDPDDLIREAGVERFKHVVDEALPLWDVIWSREVEGIDFSTPDQQASLEKRMAELFGQIADKRLKRWYELRARIHLSDLFWRSRQDKRSRFGPKDGIGRADTALIRSTELLAGIPTRQVGLERILLGLCVECPDLAEKAHEQILRLRMRGTYTDDGQTLTHQRFVDALMDLLLVERIDGPGDLYRRLDPTFSGALDFFHGRESPERAMGHRLRSRFPILAVYPPRDFVERCFQNFLEIFVVREMEDDLAGLLEDLEKTPADLDHKAEEHLLSLQRELLETRERTNKTELDLAEEAGQYRYPSGASSAGFRIAA